MRKKQVEILESKQIMEEPRSIDLPTRIRTNVSLMGGGGHIYAPKLWVGKMVEVKLLNETE